MATVIFYEKPGCINGDKQQAILRQAGHTLQCRDILTHVWTREELLPFVAGKQPVDMMNSTAPAIKNGVIVPERLSFDDALALMLQDPLLIKRPLIIVDGLKIQGFDDPRLRPYLGTWDGRDDVITCPNLLTNSCDSRR